jgi:tRNA dimethylallyltransferase
MNRLIAIVGPTAVGKSELAVHLAELFSGEIVSADSWQIYRYMDIGTAKPNLKSRIVVPHHLIDIINPDQDFSLALYQRMAYQAIGDIQRRGKLPLLVGGSGLYVWSVVEGWKIPPIPPDQELRQKLTERAAKEGSSALHRELHDLDPTAARKIDPRNVRRVVRALEVCRGGKGSFSKLQTKQQPPFEVLFIGLTAERRELYRRIDARIDGMIESGLVEEVRGLLDMGYAPSSPSMSGIGYRQIGRVLRGELDLPTAVQQIKFETHRLARHQYSWFRLTDERIHWFDMTSDPQKHIVDLTEEFLERYQHGKLASC